MEEKFEVILKEKAEGVLRVSLMYDEKEIDFDEVTKPRSSLDVLMHVKETMQDQLILMIFEYFDSKKRRKK